MEWYLATFRQFLDWDQDWYFNSQGSLMQVDTKRNVKERFYWKHQRGTSREYTDLLPKVWILMSHPVYFVFLLQCLIWGLYKSRCKNHFLQRTINAVIKVISAAIFIHNLCFFLLIFFEVRRNEKGDTKGPKLRWK